MRNSSRRNKIFKLVWRFMTALRRTEEARISGQGQEEEKERTELE